MAFAAVRARVVLKDDREIRFESLANELSAGASFQRLCHQKVRGEAKLIDRGATLGLKPQFVGLRKYPGSIFCDLSGEQLSVAGSTTGSALSRTKIREA